MNPTTTIARLSTVGLLWVARLAIALDVCGVNTNYGPDASYKLVGDTTFDYKWGGGAGDIDLNGHAFVSDTGGGNRRVISGAITGTGSVAWSGGGVPQVCPSILSGDKPNTFKGTFTLLNGVLDLDKPAGVDAIPGDLIIGTKGNAVVNLGEVQPDQRRRPTSPWAGRTSAGSTSTDTTRRSPRSPSMPMR